MLLLKAQEKKTLKLTGYNFLNAEYANLFTHQIK